MGLGAKRGSERAENFGLAGLASILGRLNGNEEAVKKEEERQEEIEKRAFVYRKYGMMNFVSGGLLVGDKIVKKADVKLEPQVKVEIKSEPESDDGKVSKKDKKRKRLEVEGVEERTVDEPTLKRKKKSMDLREEVKKENDRASSKSKKDKKNKKEKSKKSKKSSSSDVEAITSTSATPTSDPEPFTDKARRKAEKKARKQERKLKKALKKAAKEAAKANGDVDESSSDSDEDETTAASSTTTSVPATGASTPSGLAYTPRGMHAVRQRWIRQKKAATMDAQAMKEVRLYIYGKLSDMLTKERRFS